MRPIAVLFADAPVLLAGLNFTQVMILIVVVAACIALVYLALRKFGITIPDWVQQAFWIVAVAFVVILCIKLVASMW